MAFDLNKLKTEIINDPKGLGYSGKTDKWIADKLNAVGASNEKADNDKIPSWQIINAVTENPTEYLALSQGNRDLLQLITSAQMVDIKSVGIKTAIAKMFGPGTGTRAALMALATKFISRREALGFTEEVKLWHVARAKAL